MEKQEEINIQNLLNQVNLISKHYDRISSLTGEKFNIFSIMSMEKNEVYTHSAIITELLNPYGNHGQGDIFLKAFIDVINSKIDQNKNINKIPYLNNSEGLKEYTIKEFSLIKPCTGRIDIYIKNKKQCIIIENKIDAESQPDQLLRYYNYAVNKYKDEFWLIYLQKSENNHTNNDLDYSCGFTEIFSNINSNSTKDKVIKITYENEILQWLKECLKYTSNLPIIRETINQYIHLVNKITNQSNNNIMSEEIIKIIAKNSEYINAIKSLDEVLGINFINLKKRLVNNLIVKLKEKSIINGLIFTQVGLVLDKESHFIFHKPGWKYGIFFEVSEDDKEKLDVGIRMIENPTSTNQDVIFNEKVRNTFDYRSGNISETWVGWENFDEWSDIPWSEFSDDTAANIVFEKAMSMIHILESIPDLKL
jgi:hypothetical protein